MPTPPLDDIQYLDLGDYLVLAGAALDVAPEALFDVADLALAESALHAPAATYAGVEFYPDQPTWAAIRWPVARAQVDVALRVLMSTVDASISTASVDASGTSAIWAAPLAPETRPRTLAIRCRATNSNDACDGRWSRYRPRAPGGCRRRGFRGWW
jgi:hypothetical protein